MKSFIQILVILATLAGMTIFAFFTKSTDKGDFIASIIYAVLVVLITFTLIMLFRWDKKRIEGKEIELRQRVDTRIKEALKYKQPVEHYITMIHFIILALAFILSSGAIYFGTYLLTDFPVTKWLVGSAFFFGGILSGIALVVLAKRVIGYPIIRLDLHGLQHFRFGFIPWSEVTEIFLHTLRLKGRQAFFLRIGTTNNGLYQARLPRWLRVFHKIEMGPLSLALPLSEEDARVVEGVAKGYANYAGAPTIEKMISKKLLEEISALQPPELKIQGLQEQIEESSEQS